MRAVVLMVWALMLSGCTAFMQVESQYVRATSAITAAQYALTVTDTELTAYLDAVAQPDDHFVMEATTMVDAVKLSRARIWLARQELQDYNWAAVREHLNVALLNLQLVADWMGPASVSSRPAIDAAYRALEGVTYYGRVEAISGDNGRVCLSDGCSPWGSHLELAAHPGELRGSRGVL